MKRGALIVLEGIDRVGKSTAALQVIKDILMVGEEAKLFHFPTLNTPVGKILAKLLMEETSMKERALHLLFAANRWELEEEIITALNDGITVILDRYLHSGVSFAACALERKTDETDADIEEWARKLNCGLPKPDLVCLLDADVHSIMDRPGWENETQQVKDAQAGAREQFLKMRDPTWITVDASLPKKDVADRILSLVVDEMYKDRDGEVDRIKCDPAAAE